MKFVSILLFSLSAALYTNAQLVVDGVNVNKNDSLQYVQLSFYYEGNDMLPVYSIDFGDVVRDDQQSRRQQITVNGDAITGQMTPVHVFNKLYRAGWEYLGDALFMRAPIVENTQTYTFKRRAVD